MKYVLPAALLAHLLLSGGRPARAQETTDYYPLRVGNQWHYRVVQLKDGQAKAEPGNAFEKATITVEKFEDLPRKDLDKDKIVDVLGDNKKPLMVRTARLKVQSGEKTLYENVAVLADGVYRFKSADKDIAPPLLFFKFDLSASSSWKVSSLSEGKKLEGTFTGAAAKVKTPAGESKGIHIASKDLQFGDHRMEVEYWFAGGFGMVRQRVKLGSNEIFLELERFVPGK